MKKYTLLAVIIIWALISKAQLSLHSGVRFAGNDGITTQKSWLQSGTTSSGSILINASSMSPFFLFDSSKSFYQLAGEIRNENILTSSNLSIIKGDKLILSSLPLLQTPNWNDNLASYTSNGELKLNTDYFPLINNGSNSQVSNNNVFDNSVATGNSIYIKNAELIKLSPRIGVGNNNEGLVNQLDISKQTFYVNQSLWLEQSVTPNGSSILLHTTETKNYGSGSGIIAITQDSDNKFGLMLSDDKAIVGWEKSSNRELFLNASSINTDGVISTSNFLVSSGQIIQDNIASKLAMPKSIQSWIISDKESTGLLIENFSTVSNATAGLFLKQGMYTNFVGTVSNGDNAMNYPFTGSFLIQSTSPNGLALNATQQNAENIFAISFAIDSKIVAGFGDNGAFIIGQDESKNSTIASISSKGVLFPRMSSKERCNIERPEEGLMIFDQDLQKFCFYTKRGWEKISSKRIRL